MKIFFYLFLMSAPLAWAQTNNPIPANNPLIQYSGRIDFSNPRAPRFDWSGTSVTAAFHGTSIGFWLDDTADNYDVFLDGKPVTVWATNASTPLYTLDHLAPDSHVVAIVKRTEPLFGVTTFKGLVLSAGGTLSKVPDLPSRRIEIIGDSYACGYGVEATSVQCSDLRPYENADKGFGALVAQDLKAEYHLEAFSGKGIVRNGGDPQIRSANPFPPLFERTLCRDPKSDWNFSQWMPNAVIIHLGFNDFSGAPLADRKEFTHAYIEFLKDIREKYPKTFIFCVAPQGYPVTLAPTLDEIVEKRTSAGDKNIQLITYPPVTPDEMGCDGHPNIEAQRKIAEVIAPVIKETLYW